MIAIIKNQLIRKKPVITSFALTQTPQAEMRFLNHKDMHIKYLIKKQKIIKK